MGTLSQEIVEKKTPKYSGYYNSIIQYIDINSLIPPPRNTMGSDCAARFASSIEKSGFLRPILIDSSGRIEDGAKRFFSSVMLGYSHVPCVMYPTPLIFEDDLIIRSLLSDALSFFQYAEKLKILTEKHLYSQECIASALGRSQSFIANKIRLLAFSAEDREKIIMSNLTERHCRALLRIRDAEQRSLVLSRVIISGMNVSTTESYISSILSVSADPTDNFIYKLREFLKPYESLGDRCVTETCSYDGSVCFKITVHKNCFT